MCSEVPVDPALKGTWIDSESLPLQFMEFSSTSKGRFGLFSKASERYINFSYRLLSDKIAIDIEGDASGETIHDITLNGKESFEISGITALPGTSTRVFTRKTMLTGNGSKVISLGKDDIYFDFDDGYSLQAHCTGDSRCPQGAVCIWQGFAAAEFNFVGDGNVASTFHLSTYELLPQLRSDTLLQGLRFILTDITPYPGIGKQSKPEDIKVIVTVEK